MKNIIRIISLIFVVTAIGGCGMSQQYQKSTDFPKGMKTELTEQIKVNAEFQYPEPTIVQFLPAYPRVSVH